VEREEGGIGEEWKGRWKTMTDREEDSSRDGWMEDGGKVDFGIILVQYGHKHEWFDATSPYSPQGQIPFSLSYSLRRGHISILQAVLHQHHQGY